MDPMEQIDISVRNYLSPLTSDNGRFYFQQKEIPSLGYTTFTGLHLILVEIGETLNQCNVIFTSERYFITRNFKGWALDPQFIHAIEDCPGGLFKSSKRVLFKLKHPQATFRQSLFELRFPEEDVKQLFLNIKTMLDLRQACEEGRLEDFQNLLQVNPTLLVNLPIDTTRNTLLIMACAQKKSAIAQCLLKIHGIDINKTTEVVKVNGKEAKEVKEVYGALYYACINNMIDVVETLLSFKTIDVNILYTNEYSALKYAILKDMLAFKANSKKSYAKIISMLLQHPKTIWKIADKSDQYVIPTKWILEISTDTQKAILRGTAKNRFPVAFRDKLEALIQEKERKRESYKSLSGEIVRVDSSSTFATEDIESCSKISNMDSLYIINSKIIPVSGAVKNDPNADDIESSSKISRSQSSQSISSKIGDVDPFAEEVNQWKALLASLELPPTLKLSFVILNILKFEDDINIADSLKFYQTIVRSAKHKKSWMLWKNQISAQSLPELLNGKDFESFKTLVLAEIEEKYAKGVADEETFKSVYQLKAQVKSLFLSSKEFVNEINQWKALLERLELSPTLQLSFVILNILTLEDYFSNFPETPDVSARQRKLWMLWKDEILSSIYKPLSEPLNGEDFKTIKALMLAEIKELHANFLDNTADAKFFADLDQLKSLVERLALSKNGGTDYTLTNSFVAEKVKNQSEDLVLSEQKKPSFEVTAGPTSAPVIQTPFPLPPDKTSHVFISHAWAEDEEGRDNHLRVKYLNDILKKRGIVTWFDDDRIRQDKNVRTTLTNALYSTCCVLICITRKYEEKINKGDKIDHCLFEFNVATHDDELSNSIMTVVMELSMLNVGTWKRGRLKAELGDVLYTDLSSDTNFKENCEATAENIITTLKLTQQIV